MEPPEQLLDSDCSMPQAEPVDLSLQSPSPPSHIAESSSHYATLPTTLLAGPQVVSLSGFGLLFPLYFLQVQFWHQCRAVGDSRSSMSYTPSHQKSNPLKWRFANHSCGVQSLPVVVHPQSPPMASLQPLLSSLIGADGKTTAEFHGRNLS
ncbi:unnamed protein product [Ranitomeya imitator]|uniref:Uncharacterized protein n=1 Tax=Ranitomeya imitator TaxID=111125 RepID=A0ABN9LY82_9NEOB|nr:unnamed protein product [Ranitomeya imitator]